jgi:hypothetical protein
MASCLPALLFCGRLFLPLYTHCICFDVSASTSRALVCKDMGTHGVSFTGVNLTLRAAGTLVALLLDQDEMDRLVRTTFGKSTPEACLSGAPHGRLLILV